MGPKEPKNDIQYHLHKTYWGLPRKFFEKHWGLHFSLWGLQLKILVRNSIRDSIFWGLHSKYFGDSTWDSIGDSHWGLQWSPKWSPPQKKTRLNHTLISPIAKKKATFFSRFLYPYKSNS